MGRFRRLNIRALAAVVMVLALGACASPALMMPDQQILNLPDDELCRIDRNYRSEPRVQAEIRARNLNCDPYYRECLAKGNQPGTQAMQFCMDILEQNQRLRYEHDFDHPWGVRTGIYSGVGFGF